MTKPNKHDDDATNLFALPRAISHHLKACVEAFEEGRLALPEQVEYLWIDLTGRGVSAGARTPRTLDTDAWLNVIDEAASLGVHCMLVCVGPSLAQCPDIWTLCEWAQDTHAMMVGLHLEGGDVTAEELARLKQLDPVRTCLFVPQAHRAGLARLEQEGVRLCRADVDPGAQQRPCTLPECMVCVGANGSLFTCGLVLGDKHYCLGSVLDQPLEHIVDDPSLPRTIGRDCKGPHPGARCDGCPPVLAQRLKEDAD